MPLHFLKTKPDPDLVYRTAPHMDTLIFTILERALRIGQTYEALGTSTWCEFAYLMPNDDLNEMLLERNNPEEDCLK
jgi:hypothetical protein